jgi:hypothetical protein
MNITHILNKEYNFANKDGHLGTIIFKDDGTIGNYNHPNERTWTWVDGCLHVWG